MPETTASAALHTVPPISLSRRVTDHVMTGAAILTVVLVLAPLVAIFGYLVYRGIGAIDWAFLTQTPKPVGEPGGGMANAIVGSALILGIASIVGVPFGVGAGIYLAEFGRNRMGAAIRFTADVLNGVPSIVIGVAAYAMLVLHRHFSALAGGVALAIMMVPTISRTTEEMLLLVPQALREAAYGLGVPRWRTTLSDHSTHGDFRRDYRGHAGLRPRGRRDGAAAVYDTGQFILESENRSGDGGVAAADLCVRQFAL